MSHLNVRTGPDDEAYLSQLQDLWGVDSRSEVARKAIAYAATHVRKGGKPSKMEILEESGFLGCYADKSRASAETRVKKIS